MRYWPALDGLRAGAVTIVVLSHALPDYFPSGNVGVSIFFVLSGYLITLILSAQIEQTGRIAFGRFYLRRFARLTPALWLMLLTVLLITWLFSPARLSVVATAALASATYTINWMRAFQLAPDVFLGHCWSLAIEEQFYLLWPPCMILLYRPGRRRAMAMTTFALACLSMAWRSWLLHRGAGVEQVYNRFDSHADALLIGCALALAGPALTARLTALGKRLSPLVAIALILLVLRPFEWASHAYFTTALLSVPVILLCVDDRANWIKTVLTPGPIRFVGRISYGIYLWHYPVFLTVPVQRLPVTVGLLCRGLLTLALATASYYGIERPILRRVRGIALGPDSPLQPV